MDTSAIIRGAGLRVTVQRIAVLQALALAPHSSADRIHNAVAGADIALPTVHAILGDLATAGIIRRVSLPDADRALFEVEPDDNHHHMQCVRCGRLEVVTCAVGASPCLHPAEDHGMRLLEASVTYRAICAACDEVHDSA
ncbi:Fur family transcriptional regulator [Microbacterium azadirachtae]|jgi:Fur family ferric uptake transcriptional regulator|uniref:Fur family transcriptional regulator, ferric uptake regulator n=1 Tax=Microbacterium azadirachtae TaxID=582680 RepID=A0A1I6GIT5_9MICO|nr:Fur family transcriptional regulator [Microbacterium azadirachtae]SFR41987.1 Fur family transcriptional regulator, ferric uptake regulator [Microbacterium azadirachtae]